MSEAVNLLSISLAVAVLAFALLRYLADSKVPLDVRSSVFLSWSFGFYGLLLLPYDIGVSLTSSAERELVPVWSFTYWTTFVLAWIVLPLQLQYHASGCFTFRDQLIDAFRKNLRYYAVVVAIGALFFVYKIVHGSSPIGTWDFLMALGNTYGVLLLVVLAGNGMVMLPVRLWRVGDVDRALRTLYMSAVRVEAAQQMALHELQQCEAEVEHAAEALRANANTPNQAALCEHADTLLRYISAYRDSDERLRHRQGSSAAGPVSKGRYTGGRGSTLTSSGSAGGSISVSSSQEGFVSLECLECLHSNLKVLQVAHSTSERQWAQLLESVQHHGKMLAAHDILQNMPTVSLETQYNSSLLSKIGRLARSLCSDTSSRLTVFARSCALVLVALSSVLLWSELLLSTQWRSPVGIIMGVYATEGSLVYATLFGVALLFVLSLSVVVYASLFSLTGLAGPRQSNTSSLIFNAEYATRLQFSLGYNFILLVNSSELERTSFRAVVQRMTTLPVLGTGMQTYLPITMFLVGVITWFNWHQRLLNFVPGWEDSSFVDDGDDEEEQIRIGKMLIASVTPRTSSGVTAGNTADAPVKIDMPPLSQRLKLEMKSVVRSIGRSGARYDFVGSGSQEEGEADRDISMRDTIVSNPLRSAVKSDKSSYADSPRLDLDEEEEVVFNGRYSGM
jgi:hypothetical protein